MILSAVILVWGFWPRIFQQRWKWRKRNQPRLVLYGAGFHVERITFRINKQGVVTSFPVDVLSLIFANQPESQTEKAVARGLKVEFLCQGIGVWLDARLDYSAEPSELLPGQRPQLEFDLGIDKWRKVNLVVKEPKKEECFLFNNDSYRYPRAQKPEWKLGRGEHRIIVRVAGIGVRTEFECTFINPGKGAPLVVKSP